MFMNFSRGQNIIFITSICAGGIVRCVTHMYVLNCVQQMLFKNSLLFTSKKNSL